MRFSATDPAATQHRHSMNLSDFVSNVFHRNVDATMQAAPHLEEPIIAAAGRLVQCLLNEQKILLCGAGSSTLLSQYFSTLLLNRYEHERPSLPAYLLGNETSTLAAIALDGGYNDIYAKQIRALGDSQDCLVLLYQGPAATPIIRALQAAHERDMDVILFGSGDSDDARSLLRPEDIEIRLNENSRARTTELQLLIIHCLCELIEMELFGHDE